MVNAISVLGSTGSIGRQTLAAAGHLGLRVAALTAQRKIDLLEQQARQFKPAFVAVFDEKAARDFKTAVADTDIRVGSGIEGLMEAATLTESDCVVTAVSGAIGLKPTLAAIDEKKRIALANKETLVCAGEIVMKRAKERGAEIVPVDSEHSAIFQCLMGRKPGELHKILLTGSGGPFRGKARAELEAVTPEQAVAHPNWSMGAKISVDSATMMNKGLEFIEAMHLFGVTPDDITVVIHPQSVIHSMVEYEDGAIIAELGVPDMRLPIQYALYYPERRPMCGEKMDFYKLGQMTFEKPDMETFPALGLAYKAIGKGGNLPTAFNAADELAVQAFLQGKVRYQEITQMIQHCMENCRFIACPTIDEVFETEKEVEELLANWKA